MKHVYARRGKKDFEKGELAKRNMDCVRVAELAGEGLEEFVK